MMKPASILFKVGQYCQIVISLVWVMNAIYFIRTGQSREKAVEDHTGYDSHLVAALGIHWAHAVTIRLVLDSKSGLPNICFSLKFIKLS